MKDTLGFEILEAAYSLSESTTATLQRIARSATQLAPRGPVVVCTYDATGLPDPRSTFFERADQRYAQRFHRGTRAMPAQLRERLLQLDPTVMASGTEYIEWFPTELRDDVRDMTPLAIMATTGDGGCVTIGLGDPGVRTWSAGRRLHLAAIAQHLAAAWRLRSAFAVSGSCPSVMAELRIDGTPLHLHADASNPSARESLRRAVLVRERARTSRRVDASQLWPALVAGQWTLVDAFSASGTRYVVAYENPPRSASLRALRPRERIALEHALVGRSGKWIAVELGLSEPTVARILQTAVRRLGAAGLAALAGVRAASFEPLTALGASGQLAMARLDLGATALLTLSQTEQEIVRCVLCGMQVATIARERGRSSRTIAHQIGRIYQKLGVSTRRELLVRLVAPSRGC